jgi:Holliday junction resolvase RusA-like endonuclease
MSQPIYFKIPIEPVAKGRPKFGNGHAYTPAKTREAEETIAWYARENYKGDPLEGAVALKVIFHMRRPKGRKGMYHATRPDCDNIVKLVSDSLNEVLYRDDGQITDLHATKLYCVDNEEPFIEVYCELLWNH